MEESTELIYVLYIHLVTKGLIVHLRDCVFEMMVGGSYLKKFQFQDIFPGLCFVLLFQVFSFFLFGLSHTKFFK